MEAKCLKACCFELKYDHILMFDNVSILTPLLELWSLKSRCRKRHDGDVADAVCERLIEHLKTGLGPYVVDIVAAPRHKKEDPLVIGFQVNDARQDVYVMKGPELGTDAAAVFTSFWGDKAELRKYPDGIHATVSWRRGHVLMNMIDFLLKKCGLKVPEDGHGWHQMRHQLDDVLVPPSSFLLRKADQKKRKKKKKRESESQHSPFPLPPKDWSYRQVMEVFDSVSVDLRRLSKLLPLDITGVTCVSPISYDSEVFLALPVRSLDRLGDYLPAHSPVVEGLITLEISGKWPMELSTLRQSKLLFMHRVKILLLKNSDSRSCRLDKEGRLIIFQAGFVFRLTLVVLKELSLLREVTDSLGQRRRMDSPEARELEKRLIHLPAHCGRMRSLCSRFPGLSGTIRLFRRWLASQGLSGSIEWPALDLLCASVCLHPEVMGASIASCSPLTGFLRVLHLLATFPWEQQPLMVNVDDQFDDPSQLASAKTRFSSTPRGFLPPMVLVTPSDMEGKRWTARYPDIAQFQRLVSVAGSAACWLLSNLRKPVKSVPPESWRQVFRSRRLTRCDGDADVILYLRPGLLPRLHQNIDVEVWWNTVDDSTRASVLSTQGPANVALDLDAATTGRKKAKWVRKREEGRPRPWPPINFDPAATFVRLLRDNIELSTVAEFFHDPYGGRQVAVKWIVEKDEGFEEDGEEKEVPEDEEKEEPVAKKQLLEIHKPSVATAKTLQAHKALQSRSLGSLGPRDEEALVQLMVELGGGIVQYVHIVRD